MKGIDIFCASQAATAICLSMEQASCSSSSTIQLGGRAIDRHNPIIKDGRRSTRSALSAPCSSHPPINPKPYHQHQKTKKSSSSKQTDQSSRKSSSKPSDQKKKSVARPTDYIINKISSSQPTDVIRKSEAKLSDLITPPGSSRYLLSDTTYLDGLSDYNPVLSLVPVEEKTTQAVNQDESTASKSSSLSHSKPSPPDQKPSQCDQAVVLRVSLHCKGCEGKLRKHLSRMEGVTSFNIDFAAKKVTIIGDVTPMGVLASVSKVKNAQFWPSAISSTPAPSVGSGNV
ncbi:protein SODIUM POTASSIUM ROOT DEFECTIVE 1-like [Corylus avellana]|uniref:protein SODIUM POTASSIUM ROOT DEFECTIVE 1-like n=1 Tax=Corylus avellana TaxID=13451 RepID=UPI001E1F60B4|nr:protein SODIUM POTASSIUM ROOT DEFECTIVE 1-like [Corylus avellana]